MSAPPELETEKRAKRSSYAQVAMKQPLKNHNYQTVTVVSFESILMPLHSKLTSIVTYLESTANILPTWCRRFPGELDSWTCVKGKNLVKKQVHRKKQSQNNVNKNKMTNNTFMIIECLYEQEKEKTYAFHSRMWGPWAFQNLR